MSTIQPKQAELHHLSTASQARREVGVMAKHAPTASPQGVVSEVGVMAQQAPTTSSQCVVSEDGPLGNLFKEYAQALGRYYLNDADPSVDKASNVRSLHDTAAGLLRWIWTHGHRDHWLAGEADAVVQSSREHAERLARGNDDEGSRKNQGSSESCNSHFSLRELSLDDHFGPGKGRHAGGDYYPERRHSVPNEDSHRDDHDCWATRRCPDRVGGDFYRPKYD